MLNEIREYEVWTKEHSEFDNEQTRFIFSNLKDGFTGRKRPLKIVARHFMFEEGSEKPNFEKAEEAVKVWLGLKHSEDKEIDQLFNKFTEHVLLALNKEIKDKEQKKEKEKKILERIQKEQKRDYTRKTYHLGEDEELIIEDIVSQAYVDGPLRKMCLVGDCDLEEAGIIKEKKEHKKSGNNYKNEIDRLCKSIAAYKLNGGDNKDYVTLPIAEVNGWFHAGRISQNRDEFIVISTGKEYLECINIGEGTDKGNKDVGYHIDSEILTHFSIEDEDEVTQKCNEDEDYYNNHIVYLDTSIGIVKYAKENS